LKLSDLYKLETGKLIHRFVRNSLPPSFNDYFKRFSDISTRTTRSSTNPNNLYIPRYKTNRMQRSIKFQDVKIWNSIPQI